MRWTAPIRDDGRGRTIGRGGGVDGPGGRRRRGGSKSRSGRQQKQDTEWEARERIRVPPPPPPKILSVAAEDGPRGLMYIYIYIYIRPASESGLRLCRVKTTESGTCFDRIRRIRGSDSADSGTICPDSRIEDIQICVAIPISTFSALNSKHTDPRGEAPRSEITNKPSPNKKHKEPLSEAHKCQKKHTDATKEKFGS